MFRGLNSADKSRGSAGVTSLEIQSAQNLGNSANETRDPTQGDESEYDSNASSSESDDMDTLYDSQQKKPKSRTDSQTHDVSIPHPRPLLNSSVGTSNVPKPFSISSPSPVSAQPKFFTEIIWNNPQFYSERGLARVAFGGFVLGVGFTISLLLIFGNYSPSCVQLGLWLSFLWLFHTLEFVITAIYHPYSLSYNSFLLNHSKEYGFAILLSIAEYFLELFLYPEVKGRTWTMMLGIVVVSCGQFVRSLSMVTAAGNFNHIIQDFKRSTHTLVTTGIYGVVRHPAYAGWFFWSIGMQILLGNPFCTLVAALVSWRFFSIRTRYEEQKLIEFFGDEYVHYQKRVPSGIPFI